MKRSVQLHLIFFLFLNMLFLNAAPAFALDAGSGDTVVAFTSDVHHTSVNKDASAARLGDFLCYTEKTYGKVDALGVCGDLAIPNANGDTFWSYAQKVMDTVDALGIEGIYTTGNHEYMNGYFSTSENPTTERYIRLGLGKSANNYEIYCFGAASDEMEFPASDIEALSAYLDTVDDGKPVFILSHYPLHAFSFREGGKQKIRDAGNRGKVIELLNKHPNTYFIWGHNHSHDDPQYDFVQTETIGDIPICFTYAAAGSMTETAENPYSGHVTGKGMVALISQDGTSVVLEYLDLQHVPFGITVICGVDYDPERKSGALHILTGTPAPENTVLIEVCLDENGKMLGMGMVNRSLEDASAISLHLPTGVTSENVARLQVMAVDAVAFCPLGTAVERALPVSEP